jgi:hypothetical protein
MDSGSVERRRHPPLRRLRDERGTSSPRRAAQEVSGWRDVASALGRPLELVGDVHGRRKQLVG